jgi:hypothetical protein
MKIANVILLLMISALITLIIYYQVESVEIIEPIIVKAQTKVIKLPDEDVRTPTFVGKTYEPIFTVNKIDDFLYNRIKGLSFKVNDNITKLDLRYLEITYWSFDSKRYTGEMIVHKSVANEVLDIFKELYEARYPIDKITLVDDYDADDNLSMLDNNTSAFNYRVIAGTTKLSNHSYGLAIDINPFQNPYINNDIVIPVGSETYKDRDNIRLGMIIRDDLCYNAFTSRGWTWGGDWNNSKDYQHFEKDMKDTN